MSARKEPLKQIVFLDRDGTLNLDLGYPHLPSDFQLLPFASKACKRLVTAGYHLAILSNQSGIGRGLFTEEQSLRFWDLLRDELLATSIPPDRVGYWYCPHAPDAGCNCRKPGTDLYFQVEEDWGRIHPYRCWCVGDKPADLQAAKSFCSLPTQLADLNISTILIPTNYGTDHEQRLVDCSFADMMAGDLDEAADMILQWGVSRA